MANYNLTQTGAEVQELLNKVSLFGKFTCSDAADSQVKNIHIDDFTLIDSVAIAVTFVNGNSAASIQLNVNYTGNVPVYYRNSPLGAGLFTANATVILMYNATGNRWDVLSELCGTIGEAASRDVATEITDESSDEDIPTVGAVKGTMKGLPEQDCSFVFRKTAGGELTVPSGLAQLTALRGKSILWNQLQKLSDKSSEGEIQITTSQSTGLITVVVNNPISFRQITLNKFIAVTGHKYLAKWSNYGNNIDVEMYESYFFPQSSLSRGKWLITAAKSGSVLLNFYVDKSLPNGKYYFYPQVFDLTEMFGAGNEPSTVEEFEAMFPNEYYPYNTRSLLNFNAESLKTVGFNQYNPSTSKAHVLQGVVYHIQGPYTLLMLNGVTITPDSSGLFTPASTGYLIVSGGGRNTCINISDQSKNGTYEPYWESNLPLNISTQTGKLNGSGDSVVVFPNGMAGMNGVQDTIIGNTVVKKFYQVNDLTTLPITLNYEGYAPEEEGGDTVYSFILELPKNAKAFTASVMNGLFNNKYSPASGISAASYNNFYIYTLQGKSYVEIMDSTFATDARFADEEQWDALIADIRTSLADNVLMYELLSYENYTLDDMAMPLSYKIDKYGTEQIIPSAADPDNAVPSTVPCDITAKYKLSHVEEIWALFDLYHNG